ncbi:MAG: phage head morphogenesis protein, partial [Betaproteobacteria bacterium]|nr:phage head morphogenesis protein [Betaproteobacteria bacterium]
MPRTRHIELKPIHPSAALRTAYQRKLTAAIEEMHRSVVYWVLASYRANPPAIAMDEAPIRSFQRMFRKVRNRWLKNFDTLSEKMAAYFATEASKRVDGALSSMLREHDFAVKFKTTIAQREAVQATLAENVSLIKSIPERYLGDVEGLVMRSFQTGRDLGFLSKALQQNFGVTK